MNSKKAKKKKDSVINREKLGKKIASSDIAASVEAVHLDGSQIKKKWLLPVILTVFIIIPSLIVAFDLGQNLKKKEEAIEKKERLIKELVYWQNIANTHKGYRDAYFKIAILEYQLNDKEQARVYLEKTLRLDPNFEPARKLQKILSAS